MKQTSIFITLIMIVVMFTVLPIGAQQREYYLYGLIVDTQQNPLSGVDILMRDVATSRSYTFKSNKKGKFRFVGLPHGHYQVTMTKAGFKTWTNEWKFMAKQERIQKVDMKTIVMVSQEKLQQIETVKKLQADLKQAKTLIQEKKIDSALPILKKVLSGKPDNENALYLLGICYLQKKMLSEATAAFQKVTEITPSFVAGHYQLGVSLQRQDKLDEAQASYKKALELDEANLVSLYNSGLIWYQKNNAKEALPFFEKSLKLRPLDADILEMAGICSIQLADYDKALQYLTKARANTKDEGKLKSLDELIKGLQEQVKK